MNQIGFNIDYQTITDDSLKINQNGKQLSAYQAILSQELQSIIDLCHSLGKTDGHGGAQKADSSTSNGVGQTPPPPSKEQQMIDHGPIFLAILMVLFTGDNSAYHTLAKAMEALNSGMGDIKKLNELIQKIEEDLNNLMNGKGDPKQVAQDLANQQKELQKMLNPPPKELSSDLVKSLNEYVGSGGDLDKVVQEATKGMSPPCNSWQDAANNPAALKKIKDYLNNAAGGPAGKAASGIFSSTANLVGALNTQNQADVEKLNLITKKIDSNAKLLASAQTLYKGLIQTLTNYSGS